MMTLQRLSTLLHIITVVLAVAPTVYLLGFAQLTYRGVTVTGAPGQPDVTTEFTRTERFVDTAGPVAILFTLAFTGVAGLGAYAAHRGWLAPAAAAAVISLVGAYITGFSIGLMYFPAVLALGLSALVLGFGRLAGRRT
jgi:hypothetical protein